jgi:polyferredoxin
MEITRYSLVKSAMRSRWPQFIAGILLLSGFILAIIAGFAGTPVGSRNFGIVFTWIAWWALLILVAVPLFGRGWCSVCPIPLVGEWLQRGQLLSPQGEGRSLALNRRWPKPLRNIWVQNITFVLVALFSSVILTTPLASAAVLAAMLFVAIGLSMVFERRAFAVCQWRVYQPVRSSAGQLRVVKSVCASTKQATGSQSGYGCP